MEEEDPWNGGWAKGGAAEKPARVVGASAAGRKSAGRAQGEVRKPKCQRRHYQPGVQRIRNL